MAAEDSIRNFDDLELDIDKRLDKALMKCGFIQPTLTQIKTLPLALAGKDLLVKARTGSGKTLAFCLPLLNKILLGKQNEEESRKAIRAVILVPTKELVNQVFAHLMEMTHYCKDIIKTVALANEKPSIQQTWLKSLPDIVVSTPGRLVLHLKELAGDLKLRETLETLVVDEADLIFSYGYTEDVNKIVANLPRTVQSLLMSATLNEEVLRLKKLILHNPTVVKIADAASDGSISQWFCKVKKSDKDLLLFALLRLKLVTGKTLFFVNSVNSAYRLKLILEQFHVKSAVLNSELPLNSRLHIIEQFNRGIFDNLIATDEGMFIQDSSSKKIRVAEEENGDGTSDDEEGEDDEKEPKSDDEDDEKDEDKVEDDEDEEEDEEVDEEEDEEVDEEEDEVEKEVAKKPSDKSKQSKKRKRGDNEVEDDEADFGVSRGIDFENVATVVNVEMPLTVSSYIHRIGRTGRAGAAGTSLTIVDDNSADQGRLLEEIQNSQAEVDGNKQPSLLALDMKEIEGFRYRVEDVCKRVGPVTIRNARLKELKQEMLNSEKLKSHFEDNPADLALLKHNGTISPNTVKRSVATIPSYLLPSVLKEKEGMLAPKIGYVPFNRSTSGADAYRKRKKLGKYRSKQSVNFLKRRSQKGRRELKLRKF